MLLTFHPLVSQGSGGDEDDDDDDDNDGNDDDKVVVIFYIHMSQNNTNLPSWTLKNYIITQRTENA